MEDMEGQMEIVGDYKAMVDMLKETKETKAYNFASFRFIQQC